MQKYETTNHRWRKVGAKRLNVMLHLRKACSSFFPFFVHCSVENGLNFSDRPGSYISLCRKLEYEVIWGHLEGRLKLDRSLSRRLKEKTLPAGPSPTSMAKVTNQITAEIPTWKMMMKGLKPQIDVVKDEEEDEIRWVQGYTRCKL